MRTPIAVLLILVAFVFGGVAGFYVSESMETQENEVAEQTSSEAPVTNPFEEQQVNPLEGAGYQNPLEEVKFNPFE